jgi:hypothetical protein
MTNYPHVTFHLSKILDKRMTREFLDSSKKAGLDFAGNILEIHPDLKKYYELNKNKRIKFIDDYVDNYYLKNQKELLNAKRLFQDEWDQVEVDFFQETDKIFANLPWPEGSYQGFISIIPCGPRFLETKEFQSCFLWEENIVGQVIHELLHFQFYNQIGQIPEVEKANSERIWQLSEIFNDIIQSESEFVRLQGYISSISYPDHKKSYKKYEKIWEETKDAKEFILRSLNNENI